MNRLVKHWLIPIAVMGLLLLLVPAFVFIGLTGTTPSSASTCSAGTTPTVKVPNLTAQQSQNANTIVKVGQQAQVSTFGQEIAIAVGEQESGLMDLANSTVPESLALPHEGVGSNLDSVGVFQQRANWGPVSVRLDVAHSAWLFYAALNRVPGWQQMPLTVAAQDVQGSATPTAYAAWTTLAQQVVAKITGSGPAPQCQTAPSTDATGAAKIAIMHAEQALGTMYQFGGSCTDPHSVNMATHCDCSSLVQQAWAAAGKTLPRTSEEQYGAVNLITGASPGNLSNVPPGALLFYDLGEQIKGLPGHVALYLGGGKLIEAPFQGHPVHITKVYSQGWVGAGTVK